MVQAVQKAEALPPWTRLFYQALNSMALRELGLEFRVFAAIVKATEGEQAPVSCTELAGELGATRQGVLLVLKRFVSAGLVDCQGTAKSRRYFLSPHAFFKGPASAYSTACARAAKRPRLLRMVK